MDTNEKSLALHKENKGKISIESKVSINTREDLALAYTPGVAEPCRKIHEDVREAYTYTSKGNLVAVVTDGTAVLGLGDIGPEAAMPVMEGKAILFKEFAGVDAVPICLDTKNPEEIIQTVRFLAPTFGGINLEDISSPRCFEIEKQLDELLPIPVFHDDQHGTAIVVGFWDHEQFAFDQERVKRDKSGFEWTWSSWYSYHNDADGYGDKRSCHTATNMVSWLK